MGGICCVYHGAQLVECLLVAPCVRSMVPMLPILVLGLPQGVFRGALVVVHVIAQKHVFLASVAVEAAVRQ